MLNRPLHLSDNGSGSVTDLSCPYFTLEPMAESETTPPSQDKVYVESRLQDVFDVLHLWVGSSFTRKVSGLTIYLALQATTAPEALFAYLDDVNKDISS